MLRLELEAMGAIGDPPALALNIFAWRDGGSRPYDRDEITMTTHLDPEDTEPGLLAMEGDTFDGTSQVFCGMRTG